MIPETKWRVRLDVDEVAVVRQRPEGQEVLAVAYRTEGVTALANAEKIAAAMNGEATPMPGAAAACIMCCASTPVFCEKCAADITANRGPFPATYEAHGVNVTAPMSRKADEVDWKSEAERLRHALQEIVDSETLDPFELEGMAKDAISWCTWPATPKGGAT